MRSTRYVPHVLAFLVACATAACTSLLGSYNVGGDPQPGAPDGSSPMNEGGGPTTEAGAGDTSVPTDAPVDSSRACTTPTTACGSSCVNLETDADNCGSCGRSCLGGRCTAHVCGPFSVVSRIDVLDKTLVATDTDLFFGTTTNDVVQQPVAGSASVKLATAGGTVYAIAPAPPRVYFTAGTGTQWQTWKASIGSASMATILNPPLNGTPVGLVAAGMNLHTQHITSSTPEMFEMLACPLDGSACFGNYNGAGRPGSKLAAGNGYVFWTDQFGPVNAYPDAVGLRVALAPSEATPSAPAWDGTTLFWVNGGNGKLRKSPYPTPIPSEFRDIGSAADDVLVDAVNVYWSQYNGTDSDLFAALKTAPASAAPIRLTHGINIGHLAQTSMGIYWYDASGIKGIRKP